MPAPWDLLVLEDMPLSRKGQRHPTAELAFLQREVEQIFARLTALDPSEPVAAGEWSPAVDVFEGKDHLTIVVEVPGLAPDSLSVVCRNRQIVVSGARKAACVAEHVDGFLCMERPHGRFSRSIPLTQAVDVQSAEARLASGLLTVTIPKLKERRSREVVIPIQREGNHD
jgi:HSP20 family protein